MGYSERCIWYICRLVGDWRIFSIGTLGSAENLRLKKPLLAARLSCRYTVRCNRADIAVEVSSYNDIEPRALHGLTHAICHSD